MSPNGTGAESARLTVEVPQLELRAPVEVRDLAMKLVGRTRTGSEIEVRPGTYTVSVSLPDGTRPVEFIEVAPGASETLKIEWERPRFGKASQVALARKTVRKRQARAEMPPKVARAKWRPRKSLPRLARRMARVLGASLPGSITWGPREEAEPPAPAVTTGFQMRFLTFGVGGGETTVPADGLRMHSSECAFDEDVLQVSVRVDCSFCTSRLTFAQIAMPGRIPISVALPISPDGMAQDCMLNLAISGGRVDTSVELGGHDAVREAAHYVERGDLANAAAVISQAEDLLFGKVAHPLGAVVGGYILLRLGALDRLHDWPKNLASWFEWLPDGAVIAGEQAVRRGDVPQAIEYFLQAANRGLPVFAGVYSMLLSRLQEFASSGDTVVVGTDQVRKSKAALRRIRRWASFVDFAELVTTVRGADLGDPLSSQCPIERFHRVDGWKVFRVETDAGRGCRGSLTDPKE